VYFLIVRLDGQFIDELKRMREGDASRVAFRMGEEAVVVAAAASETREMPR
jgi:hypothetical protein